MTLENLSDALRADLDKLSRQRGDIFKPPRLKEGERRFVTVLFLDIKGFTAMSEKLDPEDVQLIIDRCFKILTGEIERFGGHIDKYEGDRIMALFGSLKANEYDCENAIRAALSMKKKFIEINEILRERGIEIGIRIGINTGLVVTGKIGKERDQDFTVMGDTVNLAARLESNAPENEIMIEESTKAVAGDIFSYESLGEISVKGKTDPIKVYKVAGLNSKKIKKHSLFTSKDEVWVNREKELQFLIESYRNLSASDDRLKVIALKGAPGIGKSSLADKFIATITQKENKTLLTGRCFSAANSSFSLFVDAIESFLKNFCKTESLKEKDLDEYISALQDRSFKESLTSSKAIMKYLFLIDKSSKEFVVNLKPEALSLEIRLFIKNFLASLAFKVFTENKGPLLLNIEDVQWADSASRSMLSYLFDETSFKFPLMVILQCRDDFNVEDVIKGNALSSLELKPFSKKDMLLILKKHLGSYFFPAEFETRIILKSMGNPFYLEEMLNSLFERGIIIRENKGFTLSVDNDSIALPESIKRVLLSRIDALDQLPKKILLEASVVGEEIDKGLLENISLKTGIDKDMFEDGIELLIEKDFLAIENGKYFFKTPVVRETVYETLLNYNRKLLHHVVGTGILDKFSSNDEIEENARELSHHFIRAQRVEEAYLFSAMAIERAMREYSSDEALKISEEIVDLLEMSAGENGNFDRETAIYSILEMKAKILDILGERTGQKEVIDKLMEITNTLKDSKKRACTLTLRAKYNLDMADYKRAQSDALEILALLKGEKENFHYCEAMRVLGMVSINCGEYEKALEFFKERVSAAENISEVNPIMGSSSSITASSYNAMGLVHQRCGKAKGSLEYYLRALNIVESIKDKIGIGMTKANMGMIYLEMSLYEKSLSCYEDALIISKEAGYKKGVAAITGNIGVILGKMGMYKEALKSLNEASKLRGAIDDIKGMSYDILNAGIIHKSVGNLKEAIINLNKALDMGKNHKSNNLVCTALSELCDAIVREQDKKELNRAMEYANEALEIARVSGQISMEFAALLRVSKTHACLENSKKALETSLKTLEFLDSREELGEYVEEAYLNHYKVLRLNKRENEAKPFLLRAYETIQSKADKFSNQEYKNAFLNNIPLNREILLESKNNEQ